MIHDLYTSDVSFEKRIVMEIDGGQHAENLEYDEHLSACKRIYCITILE
jgi:very-short-patch-repair endonuclease